MIQNLIKFLVLAATIIMPIDAALAQEEQTPKQCKAQAEADRNTCFKDCRQEAQGKKLACVAGDNDALKQCILDCVNTFSNCVDDSTETFKGCKDTCRDSFRTTFDACNDGLNQSCSQVQACLLCRNDAIFTRNSCLNTCRQQKREAKIIGGCLTNVRSCVKTCKDTNGESQS